MCLKIKIFLLALCIGLPLCAQTFVYSYTDPCTQELKFINADMNSPIVIAYYGQVKTFSYTELQDGTFDAWINDTYIKYKSTSPCQGIVTTTTTTTSTNTTLNIISSVMNLGAISNVGSISSVGVNVGSSTSSGTNVGTTNKENNGSSSSNRPGSTSSNSSNPDSKAPEGGEPTQGTGSSGDNPSSPGSDGGSNSGSSSGSSSGSNSSGSSSGSSGSGSSGSSSGKTEEKTEVQTEKPSDKQVEETKTETQKTQSSSTAKAAGKAKAEVAKPAILVTGDIVGIQTKADGSQDARGTASFTRVKGDGTASIGFSADYMVNAKIGNLSAVRSWIGTNKAGNKHVNVASIGLGLLPKSTTANALLIRVNSIKSFTALYGVSGTYGTMFGEELISTIMIGGFMYKGKIGKALDATIIMAGIYSPYSKFYTESIFEAKPIVIPFLNLNYKLTKTFGVGLTGGGTYIAGQDIVNFQILMGAKLKI